MDQRLLFHSREAAYYAPGFIQFDDTAENISVLECIHEASTDSYDISVKDIHRKELAEWLSDDGNSESSPVIKLVVFTYNWNMDPYQLNARKEDLDTILEAYDLNHVYAFCGSSRDGFAAFDNKSDKPKFGLQVMADYSVEWFYDPERKVSRGVAFFPPGFHNTFRSTVTEMKGAIMREPLYLATAFVVATVATGWEEAEAIFRKLRETEEQTGFSVWSDHYITAPEADYGELSATTTGTKARNVQNNHYTQYTLSLIDFVACNAERPSTSVRPDFQRASLVTHDSDVSKPMLDILQDCEQRLRMLDMFSTTLEKRLDAQLTAVSPWVMFEMRR